jgi:hypothetical protein
VPQTAGPVTKKWGGLTGGGAPRLPGSDSFSRQTSFPAKTTRPAFPAEQSRHLTFSQYGRTASIFRS